MVNRVNKAKIKIALISLFSILYGSVLNARIVTDDETGCLDEQDFKNQLEEHAVRYDKVEVDIKSIPRNVYRRHVNLEVWLDKKVYAHETSLNISECQSLARFLTLMTMDLTENVVPSEKRKSIKNTFASKTFIELKLVGSLLDGTEYQISNPSIGASAGIGIWHGSKWKNVLGYQFLRSTENEVDPGAIRLISHLAWLDLRYVIDSKGIFNTGIRLGGGILQSTGIGFEANVSDKAPYMNLTWIGQVFLWKDFFGELGVGYALFDHHFKAIDGDEIISKQLAKINSQVSIGWKF